MARKQEFRLSEVLRALKINVRLARRGGRSPRRGTESARDYFTGKADVLRDLARTFRNPLA